jgi:hypothetical protein
MYVPPLQKDGDEALLFALEAALETFRFSQTKIQECECCIQQHLAQFGYHRSDSKKGARTF